MKHKLMILKDLVTVSHKGTKFTQRHKEDHLSFPLCLRLTFVPLCETPSPLTSRSRGWCARCSRVSSPARRQSKGSHSRARQHRDSHASPQSQHHRYQTVLRVPVVANSDKAVPFPIR